MYKKEPRMQNCEQAYANIEDLLHGANPPQEPLHDLMRDICAVATEHGYTPTVFRRALGGAEIIWDTPDWGYTLGLTTGVPNMADTSPAGGCPVKLVEALQEHFPALLNAGAQDGAGRMLQQGVASEIAVLFNRLRIALSWTSSSDRIFWSVENMDEIVLKVESRGFDRAEATLTAAGIHLAKDYEGRLAMLCKDLDLPLL